MHPRPIILILGPTAGGKTRLAIDLANGLPHGGECIGADSMQVYRGMDIGTAKPTPAERAEAPHHLLDVADPADDGFTVDTWLALAEEAIAGVRGRDRHPIVVGGTNLYVQTLLGGLFEGPQPDPALRERIAAMPPADLRVWLERIDPAAAARIHPNDHRRTVRAIEVHEQTGRPLSEHQRQWAAAPRDDVVIVGLEWPVPEINRRINDRVRAMVAAGLFEEVCRLLDSGLGRQAREGLGYRQVIGHLEGRLTREEAIEQIKIRTRRFAKQQRTWLRRFRTFSRAVWLPAGGADHQLLAEQALEAIAAITSEAAPGGGKPVSRGGGFTSRP